MVMHKRFIPNIYIQVALTAKDELFHNLICVPDCEVARDGMNHLCKIPSELGSLVDSSFQCRNQYCFGGVPGWQTDVP